MTKMGLRVGESWWRVEEVIPGYCGKTDWPSMGVALSCSAKDFEPDPGGKEELGRFLGRAILCYRDLILLEPHRERQQRKKRATSWPLEML